MGNLTPCWVSFHFCIHHSKTVFLKMSVISLSVKKIHQHTTNCCFTADTGCYLSSNFGLRCLCVLFEGILHHGHDHWFESSHPTNIVAVSVPIPRDIFSFIRKNTILVYQLVIKKERHKAQPVSFLAFCARDPFFGSAVSHHHPPSCLSPRSFFPTGSAVFPQKTRPHHHPPSWMTFDPFSHWSIPLTVIT